MRDTLLLTKLHIPHPKPDIVSRPRLIERLEAGSHRKLTLVSAPAGYGKSTLVCDWISRSDIPATWLTLEESDNEFSQFVIYMIAALQQISPDVGGDIPLIFEGSADPSVESVMTELVNDITKIDTRFVFVLDDYHVIQEIQLHKALDFLFDHFPLDMHLVIISRTDPPMPLGRLRVQRELTEIREIDLRFNQDETSAFLNKSMGLGLSQEEIKKLDARTEGWVAGLQLAALTLQERRFRHDRITAIANSQRHLIGYLAEEVLSQQPEMVQEFLLHTAVLERFCASLGNAMTQGDSGIETLLYLEKANLFLVPLDNQHQWFRYHHLFSHFLRQHLRATKPDIIPELFIRASQWYETYLMFEEAIEYALQGKDLKRAARILDEHAETLLLSNADVSRFIRWADNLPMSVRAEFPRLCIFLALALQTEYQLESVEPNLALAEATLSDPARWPESFSGVQITAYVNAIRAYLTRQRGDYEGAIRRSLAALEVLSDENNLDIVRLRGIHAQNLGMAFFLMGEMETAQQYLNLAIPLNQRTDTRWPILGGLEYLMMVEFARGSLTNALAKGEEGLYWIEEWTRSEGIKARPVRMLSHFNRRKAAILYERNDLVAAAENLNKSLKYYELTGSWTRVDCYALLIDLYQAMGDMNRALRYLGKLKRINITSNPSLPLKRLASLISARSLLLYTVQPSLDDLLAEAVEWAQTSGMKSGDSIDYMQEFEYLTYASVLIAQNEITDANQILDQLIFRARNSGRNGELIKYLSHQAIAYYSQNKIDEALDCLSSALSLAEPEGYIRTFVDIGYRMRELLQLAWENGIERHYVTELQSAFPVSEASTVQIDLQKSLIEPLNEREMQVLGYIAAGLTDRDIAEELYLSINTVKWYDRQLYSKLGVNSRGRAVARAKEIGILK